MSQVNKVKTLKKALPTKLQQMFFGFFWAFLEFFRKKKSNKETNKQKDKNKKEKLPG